MTDRREQFTNRLAQEQSPYLLQHANNPVDWYPWGPEAFARAREENKPIFLSIGYSTCHWCHVMAHESFEDTAVARLMNETFVSIKVDREERPDIDNIYMTVCQMMTGGGGWPLTVIMTPDRKPFFAGTYFPKHTMGQRIGMLDLVPRIGEIWTTRRNEIDASADEIARTLQPSRAAIGDAPPAASVLDSAFERYRSRFDSTHGGFGSAPKFPVPANLCFLLRYWKRTGNPEALAMVEKTLQSMRRGGLYDHIGFGFHRYSTDAQWLLPHFEKMLYDQAQLVIACAEAHQATADDAYAQVIREVLAYVERDMTDPAGGFYSAEDADSEGEEGKFYLWSEADIRDALPAEDAELFLSLYSFTSGGNFLEQATQRRTGTNIPHLTKSLEQAAQEHGMSMATLRERMDRIRETLFAVREQRVRPYKDDKILTDWNGLMIAAFAIASRSVDEPSYAASATRAADFVLSQLRRENGRLLHRYRNSVAGIDATAEDYAYLVWGLLELYETAFDIKYLEHALALNRDFIAHFWDDREGGFFLTADDAEELIARPKEVYDGAMPSANSVALLNLYRLARLTADAGLEEKAARMGQAFAADVMQMPTGHAQLLVALDYAIGPSHEIVIAGDPNADDTRAMLRALRRSFIPNKVVLLQYPDDRAARVAELAMYAKDLKPNDGRATAYVCQDFACLLPTTDPAKMLILLGEK